MAPAVDGAFARWLANGAGELSDRLSRRYFALIDADTHALAT